MLLWEFLGFAFLLLCSAFYSGSEAVLMSIGPDRIEQLIQEGGREAKLFSFMRQKANELLITILVGNNIVNVWLAAMATAIFARVFGSAAVGMTVFFITLLILIFGEITPKIFFRNNAEKIAVPVLYFLRLNYWVLFPVVRAIFTVVHKFFGSSLALQGRLVTKDDIEFMVNKAEMERTMDSKQVELLSSILEFPTIKVKDIMIGRDQVKYIDASWGHAEILRLVQEDVHSRYPVADGNLDKIIGFMHVKDLAFIDDALNFDLRKIMRPPFFVYEHMKIQAVFDHMNRRKVHLAIVKNEGGLVVGIITLEDIIEQIVGEIGDEHDEQADLPPAEVNLEGGALVEGKTLLLDLNDDYGIEIPPSDNYSTLSGFILDLLGNSFPKLGQIIVWEGYSFELHKIMHGEILEVIIRDVEGKRHIFSKKEAQELFAEHLADEKKDE